jgi:hypothetical protein
MAADGHQEMDAMDKLSALKDKVSRTTKFLKELKTLSKSCQEMSSGHNSDDVDDESGRERQVGTEHTEISYGSDPTTAVSLHNNSLHSEHEILKPET